MQEQFKITSKFIVIIVFITILLILLNLYFIFCKPVYQAPIVGQISSKSESGDGKVFSITVGNQIVPVDKSIWSKYKVGDSVIVVEQTQRFHSPQYNVYPQGQ